MHKTFKELLSEASVGKADRRRASVNIVKYLQKTLDKEYKPCDGNIYANGSGTYVGYLFICPADNSAIRVNWAEKSFHSINVWNDYINDASPSLEIFTGKIAPGDTSFARLLPEIAAAIKDGGFPTEDDEPMDELAESASVNEAYEYNGKTYGTKVDIVHAMYDEGKSVEEIKAAVGYPPGHIRNLIARYKGEMGSVQKSNSGKVKVVKGVPETVLPNKGTKKADEILDDTEYADPNIVFKDLAQYVELIGRRYIPALLITGQGGIGKSFTVTDILNKFGKKGEDYVIMKGRCTPSAMYKFLYNHYNQICVFDDCDSVFGSEDGMNILKGALDSGNPREISWMTKGPDIVDTFGMESHEEIEQTLAAWSAENHGRDGTPSYFQFKGAVVFISNLTKRDIYKKDRAILSRCTVIDIVLRAKDVINRIETVLPHIKVYDIDGKNYATPEGKKIVFDFISSDEFLQNPRMRGKEVNFRLFNQVYAYWAAGFENWKDLAFRAGG